MHSAKTQLIIAAAASSKVDLLPLPKESQKDFHELNFKWRNQRQLRKRRRTLQAAGCNQAHATRLRGKTR